MKKLRINLDADFYDEHITVYDMENGKYLVRDSKECIQFQCTRETLNNYDFMDDYSFSDDVFFDKINAQNYMDLENRDSLYYINTLFIELDRIVMHCSENYIEFQDGYQIPKEYLLPKPEEQKKINSENESTEYNSHPFFNSSSEETYKIRNTKSSTTFQDEIVYNGKIIKSEGPELIEEF